MDFQFASFCLIVSEYHTFVFPESSEYMKYAMISVLFFNISFAFSTPITINAVAYASAVAQSLASTVAESRLCCTGLPVLGSIVWAYFKDEAGNVIQDEYHAIGKDETIDLTRVQNATGHTIELIVGSGQQLDPGNVRYIINVYTSKKISEELEFEVYTQDRDSSREKVEIVKENFLSSDSKIKDSTGKAVPAWNYYYTVAEDEYLQPHLSVTSKADQRPDVDVEIYVTDEYLKDQQAKPITNKILNQDMSVADAGYAFNKLTSSGTGESFIFLYYQDGIQVDVLVVNFLLGGMASNIEGSLYSADGQGNVVYQTNQSFSLQEGMAEVYEYVLRPEYSAEGEYYCSLDVVDGVTGEVNDRIKKVVVGHYSSFDEAEDLPDIQDELFGDKGYLSNYGDEGIDFTIFFNDSMFGVEGAYQITVKAVDYVKIILVKTVAVLAMAGYENSVKP